MWTSACPAAGSGDLIGNLPLDTKNIGVQAESSIWTNATGAFPSRADSHQSAIGPGTEMVSLPAAIIGGVSLMGEKTT